MPTASYFSVHAQVCTCCALVMRSIIGIFKRSHIDNIVFVVALCKFALSNSWVAKIVTSVIRLVVTVDLRVFNHDCLTVLILLGLDYFELSIRHVAFVRALNPWESGVAGSIILNRGVSFSIFARTCLEIALIRQYSCDMTIWKWRLALRRLIEIAYCVVIRFF